jgi:HEAT repeat protein
MGSVSEWMARLAPAAIVLKAIVVSMVGISGLMIFILLRRWMRGRYFARREQQTFEIRQRWNDLVNGNVLPETWRFDPLACEVLETMLLDSIEVSHGEELPRLVNCLRRRGLIDRRIEEARSAVGWQRWRALVALGRTRAREAVPALAEALDSGDMETRIAAVRGMGKLAFPEAAIPILDRWSDGGLMVPGPVLKNALLNCCRSKPGALLLYIVHATGSQRELLARVLAELADPSMVDEMLVLASDASPEIRAAAARGLSQAEGRIAVPPLAQLASDPEWFVRLRAVVALGSFDAADATAVLIRALADRNRHVRQRAAWALMNSRQPMTRVLRQVVGAGDNYGLQAVVAELERSGRFAEALGEVQRTAGSDAERLAAALRAAHSRLALDSAVGAEKETAGMA